MHRALAKRAQRVQESTMTKVQTTAFAQAVRVWVCMCTSSSCEGFRRAMQACKWICGHMYVCVHVYMYVCMYVCVYICVCVCVSYDSNVLHTQTHVSNTYEHIRHKILTYRWAYLQRDVWNFSSMHADECLNFLIDACRWVFELSHRCMQRNIFERNGSRLHAVQSFGRCAG